jgi:dihydrodipicolinate synthase/N-acetylneuraminate lyase
LEPCFFSVDSQVWSTNWKRPDADDVRALAAGLNPLSRLAAPIRNVKSTPVALEARWIADSTTLRMELTAGMGLRSRRSWLIRD